MKVLIVPYSGDENPYLRLLAGALEEAGASVRLIPKKGWFPFWEAALRWGKFDILHLHWHHTFFLGRPWPRALLRTLAFFLQWFILRLQGVRFVWTVHNVLNHEQDQAGWELAMNRVLARVVDARIVLCAKAREVVARMYRIAPEKIAVVPIGHYIDWYAKPPERRLARYDLGLPVDGRIFLCFGAVRTYKGLDRILDAFAELDAPEARLIVLGQPRDAVLKQSILEKASRDPRVRCHLEFVEEDELMTYLGACDFAVFSHLDILASASVILAASCGRGLIMPRIGCLEEFPSDAAILFEPSDTTALQRALKQGLIADADALGMASRDFVARNTWPQIGRSTMDVYHSVLPRAKVSIKQDWR